MVNGDINDGFFALRNGKKDLARSIFLNALKTQPGNDSAWLGLSGCVESMDQKKYCLQKALSINPHNKETLNALQQLEITAVKTQDQFGFLPLTNNPPTSTSPFINEDSITNDYSLGEKQSVPNQPNSTQGIATNVKGSRTSILKWILLGLVAVFLGSILLLVANRVLHASKESLSNSSGTDIAIAYYDTPELNNPSATTTMAFLLPMDTIEPPIDQSTEGYQIYCTKTVFPRYGQGIQYAFSTIENDLSSLSTADAINYLNVRKTYVESINKPGCTDSYSKEIYEGIEKIISSYSASPEYAPVYYKYGIVQIANVIEDMIKYFGTPTSEPITSITKTDLPGETLRECQSGAFNIYSSLTPFLKDTDAVLSVINKSISVEQGIQELQRIRGEIVNATISAPRCSLESKKLLLEGMDKIISYYGIAGASQDTYLLTQGIYDIRISVNQFYALSTGSITPAPIVLPSPTRGITPWVAVSTPKPISNTPVVKTTQPPKSLCPSDYEVQLHEYYLGQIDYIYLPLLDSYKELLRQAMLDGNALVYASIQQQYNAYKAQYESEVASENNRYENLCN